MNPTSLTMSTLFLSLLSPPAQAADPTEGWADPLCSQDWHDPIDPGVPWLVAQFASEHLVYVAQWSGGWWRSYYTCSIEDVASACGPDFSCLQGKGATVTPGLPGGLPLTQSAIIQNGGPTLALAAKSLGVEAWTPVAHVSVGPGGTRVL